MRILKSLAVGLLILCPVLIAAEPAVQQAAQEKPQDRLTGIWRGEYHYPGNGQASVAFRVVLVQEGSTVVGFMREPNTFGGGQEPYLHAVWKGRFDDRTGKLTMIKTYDGTGAQAHDVDYAGQVSRDGNKLEGDWTLGGGFAGTFTLERVPGTGPGPLAGVWSGTQQFADGANPAPTKFTTLIVHEGKKITGAMKESNPKDNKAEPWLQAEVAGQFDKGAKTLKLTKTFDGTAGQKHSIGFAGKQAGEGNKVEGDWTMNDKLGGRFTLQKLQLDRRTVESLK